MKTIKKVLFFLSALPMAFIFSAASKAEIRPEVLDEEPILVGRITHIEGELFRHQPGDENWMPTVEDTPFGAGESLYTEGNSRAEIILPNGTWARFDGGTQIQLMELRDDLTAFDLSSGTARFYSYGVYSLIKVTTVFGSVTAPAGTEFDLHFYGNAVEVIALKGSVSFWQGNTDQRFEVTAVLGAIVADTHTVSFGKGHEPPGWAAWNRERDALWAARMTSGAVSAAYLPPNLSHEAYALDENGVWERAYFDNGYYYFWRPTHVAVGWAPFTVGCWRTWHHESTWVPYEPFGYLTHHYGNWVIIGNAWYWAPPVVRVRPHVRHPLFHIGFAWYPGRVAWLQFGTKVGWVPLAPHEPYYAHRRWGHKAVVVRDVHLTVLNVNLTHYKNHRHAVFIDRNDLPRFRNYREIRITGVERDSIPKNYQMVRTLDHTPTKPISDTRYVRNPARALPEPKPYSTPAGMNGPNPSEKVRGVPPQATKTRETLSKERPSKARQRPQAQPRESAISKTGSTGPIVIAPSPPKQANTIGVASKQWEESGASVNKREAPKSKDRGQPPATKVDLPKGNAEVSRTPNWPMVERPLSKPVDRDRGKPNNHESQGKFKEGKSPMRPKASSFRAMAEAWDNGKRAEQPQQRRLSIPSSAFNNGRDSRVSLGTGRFQSSSRGSIGGNNNTGLPRN